MNQWGFHRTKSVLGNFNDWGIVAWTAVLKCDFSAVCGTEKIDL